MLETVLTRIAVALEALLALATSKNDPGEAAENPPPAASSKKAKTTKVAPAPEPEPDEFGSEEPEAAAEEDFLGEDEPPAKEYTLEDVRAALVAYQKVSDAKTSRAVLSSKGGVDALAKLKPEKFAAVIEAAQKATEAASKKKK